MIEPVQLDEQSPRLVLRYSRHTNRTPCHPMHSRESWLDQYASGYHAWQRTIDDDGRLCFYRPLGLVERGFDLDGYGHEGRADINATLELDIVTTCTQKQLEKRILLAWTALRLHHVLLLSKAVFRQSFMRPAHESPTRYYLIQFPENLEQATSQAQSCLSYLEEDQDSQFSLGDLFHHAQNVARVVQPTEAMARLFVGPIRSTNMEKCRLQLLLVMGHQISDGLTNYTWLSHFLRLLNSSIQDLRTQIRVLLQPQSHAGKLPAPQEDLYLPVSGTRARQRWYWAIIRVMRHIRRPLPACFQNPLRRQCSLTQAQALPPVYGQVLNYSKSPPLTTFTVEAHIPARLARRLVRLCRQAHASIGAGSFTLTAMILMAIYEQQQPNVPADRRLPFIGGFPLNPRPFFRHHSDPDSLMLAFSDGVVLPFLPSHLDLAKRFRLLVRQAHRQLRQYQKRRTSLNDPQASVSSANVVAHTYVGSFDRLQKTSLALSPEVRASLLGDLPDPQGRYPARANATPQTCGISSVGKSGWQRGLFDLDSPLREGEDAFIADFANSKQNVRAREGEFLVGVWGEADGQISANVSADGNTIDPQLAQQWKHLMETILEQLPEETHL